MQFLESPVSVCANLSANTCAQSEPSNCMQLATGDVFEVPTARCAWLHAQSHDRRALSVLPAAECVSLCRADLPRRPTGELRSRSPSSRFARLRIVYRDGASTQSIEHTSTCVCSARDSRRVPRRRRGERLRLAARWRRVFALPVASASRRSFGRARGVTAA